MTAGEARTGGGRPGLGRPERGEKRAEGRNGAQWGRIAAEWGRMAAGWPGGRMSGIFCNFAAETTEYQSKSYNEKKSQGCDHGSGGGDGCDADGRECAV